MGLIKDVSRSIGVLNGSSDIKKLFDKSIDSYETYENIAVRREQSK
ncbi:MAG: hypothetical protein IPN39_13410 [Chitinophagaceae bacterium]|nr:hypothetical protein [Chitinophagaceae bacterium]